MSKRKKLEYLRKYRAFEKGKKVQKKAQCKIRQTEAGKKDHRERMAEYYKKHPEKHNHGKKRGFGNILIGLNHLLCVSHHIDRWHVIAVPKEIHEQCSHSMDGSQGLLAVKLEGVLG